MREVKQVCRKRRFKNADLYLLLIPAVVQLILFRYAPLAGLQIAFKDYSTKLGIWGSPWNDFAHFIRFFNSYKFWEILGNTLTLSVGMLLFTFPIPLIFSLLLNQLEIPWFKKTLQTMSYAPYFISTVVLVGMLYTFLSPSSGIVNVLLNKLGMESNNFMGNSKAFAPIYILSAVWQTTGYSAVIYIAALAGISTDLYEAAKIDGASKLQRLLHIELPSLIPTAVILLVMNLGQIMNIGYEKAFLMQNPLNLSSSEIIATYVYKVGLAQAQYDFSTAVNLFNTVINFILLIAVNRAARKTTGEGLW